MRSVKRGAIAALVVGTFAGTLVLMMSAPATAATESPSIATAQSVVRHPELDWAGSQVAKHEPHPTGTGGMTPLVTQTPGLDVSSFQGNVNWSSVAANGAKFAYTKATEGTYYTNPFFAQQYNGSYNAHLIRGGYHFATPDTTGGATQADYFVNHGGGWSKDGRTLPGMLDMEWNPYGAACYGQSQAGMANWVRSFSNEYHARTSRYPVIYTATSWWNQCVGTQAGDLASNNPLMIAFYSTNPGPMPFNWGFQTIWQFSDHGTFPGDQDRFNGDITRVQALANG